MNKNAKSWRTLQRERRAPLLDRLAPWILIACLIAGGMIDKSVLMPR